VKYSSRNELDETTIFCGELCKSNSCSSKTVNLLNYNEGSILANVTTRFDKFLETPQELPNRIIDLLQIAAYIFCADRCINRGARDSISNASWGRVLRFKIPVNDINFWGSKELRCSLEAALSFMTGDRQYLFEFYQAAKNPIKEKPYQMSLFSMANQAIELGHNVDIMLFSGGLDSLAGAVERLNQYPDRRLCLVNHMSNNRTIKAQKLLVKELKKKFNDRIIQYTFECRFKNLSSRDETQRTRMFLFSAIAFAISNFYGKNEFFVYENGVTSINLPKQTDLINARASRTTHPKTMGLLKVFYQQFDCDFRIQTPFQKSTKEDIVRKLIKYKEEELIKLSVSCSSSRNVHEIQPHCGFCSQCIDRRFATYAAGIADDYDDTYAVSAPYDELNPEANQRVSSTLMFAGYGIGETTLDFLKKYPTELLDVISYWPNTPEKSLEEIFSLFCAYRDSVQRASETMQKSFTVKATNSAGHTFASRVYQKLSYEEQERLKFEECVQESVFVVVNHERTRQGSGFYLSDYGFLTSYHITQDGDFYSICHYQDFPLSKGMISKELNEICSDETIDYALYAQNESCLHCFQIGDSQSLNIGEKVKVIGFPNHMEGDTYYNRSTEICKKTRLFNTPLFAVKDSIIHGMSGGLVLDKDNKVVGIIRAGIETAEEQIMISKQGFVPIDLITKDIDQKGG